MPRIDVLLPFFVGGGLGLMLRWTRLSTPDGLQKALALRRSHAARSLFTALGWGVLLTAMMAWLAVIDVDTIHIFPLHGGVLMAGALFGVAAGWSGFTPLMACAGAGSLLRGRWGRPLEALCTLAGVAAAAFLPLGPLPGKIAALPPQANATLFRVTLDKPFLLDGGFRGQMLLGLLILLAGMCILPPRRRTEPLMEAALPETATEEPEAVPPAPETAPEETFVALLPGEEALVVDTEMDAPAEPEAAPEESAGEESTVPDLAPLMEESAAFPEIAETADAPLPTMETAADPDVFPGGDPLAMVPPLPEGLVFPEVPPPEKSALEEIPPPKPAPRKRKRGNRRR